MTRVTRSNNQNINVFSETTGSICTTLGASHLQGIQFDNCIRWFGQPGWYYCNWDMHVGVKHVISTVIATRTMTRDTRSNWMGGSIVWVKLIHDWPYDPVALEYHLGTIKLVKKIQLIQVLVWDRHTNVMRLHRYWISKGITYINKR
jgi:hypothetical protein